MKIILSLLTLCTIGIGTCLGGGISPANLKALYDVYNSSLFDGKLTSDVKIKMGNLPESMAVTECTIDRTHCEILFDRNSNNTANTAKWTLIHEMCHIQAPAELEAHGIAFQACMVSIADKGGFKGIW